MEEAKLLLRTAVRIFYPIPRSVLILDSLLLHHILHMDDFNILLSAQTKEVRQFLNPLRSARFVATHSKKEIRVGGADRSVSRDYFYVNMSQAVDAIKYRMAKLRREVESVYKEDGLKKKDWYCPRCKAEYEQMQILTFEIGAEGYMCERCGYGLVQDVEAIKERGSHAKIIRLNDQLAVFDSLIAKVDEAVERGRFKEVDFEELWNKKVVVERGQGQGVGYEKNYVAVKEKGDKKGPEVVKAENLAVNLTSEEKMSREEREEDERRRERVRKQNLLPEWHAKSAIGLGGEVTGEGGENGVVKGEEKEEKIDKAQQDMKLQMEQYLEQMERERLELERKKLEEEEEEEDDDDDEMFEDVGTPAVDTPASEMQDVKPVNGVKRELEEDSSEAATPASFGGDAKRAKLEANGGKEGRNGAAAVVETAEAEDSEEDVEFVEALH